MKYAAAMKYGGELVAAEDCDYDDFKKLVPLCPECKEPVFLQRAHTSKSRKGKEFRVGAAWSHFKGISEEHVAGCENRVNGYTAEERAKIATKARGQRLKLIQRWFWTIWKNHCIQSFAGRELAPDFIPVLSWTMKTAPRQVLEVLPRACDAFLMEMSYYKDSFYKEGKIDLVLNCINDTANHYGLRNVRKQDVVVALEAIGYLSSKRNQQLILECLLTVADIIYQVNEECFLQGHVDLEDLDMDNKAKQAMIDYREAVGPIGFASAYSLIAKKAESLICTVDWASEFQRLEAESKSRVPACPVHPT